jgi:hypothetical protein
MHRCICCERHYGHSFTPCDCVVLYCHVCLLCQACCECKPKPAAPPAEKDDADEE